MLREIGKVEKSAVEGSISREEDFVFVRSEFGVVGEEEVLVEYTGDAQVIILPEKTEALGAADAEKSVFRHPENVKKVVFNSAVSSIGDYAFSGCSNLEEIYIPENVSYLWYTCSTEEQTIYDLEEVERSHIFLGCTSLKKVVFHPKAWEWEDISDALFKDCVSLRQVELPETIQWIGRNMFEGCVSLEEIVLPDSVAVIGANAFKNCRNLKKVILPDHPLAIHPTAFQGTPFHPPMEYTRWFNLKKCPVCGGKLSYLSQCKKCGRQICYCGGKSEWE